MEWKQEKPPQSGWYWLKLTESTCELGYFNSLWGIQVNDRPGYFRWNPEYWHAGPIFPPPFPVPNLAEVVSIEKEPVHG